MKQLISILLICATTSLHAAGQSQSVDLETGQPLDLATLGGPNVQIVITNYDSHDVSFTTADFDRMVVVVSGGNGGSQPTKRSQQVAITGTTVLFRRGSFAVLYAGSPRMNHVTLSVLSQGN